MLIYARNTDKETHFGSCIMPPSVQDSPNITVSMHDADYGEVISRRMEKGQGNKAPLLVNDFQALKISSSDPSSDAFNVLTVTLATRAALELTKEDFQIYICGLQGSSTASTSSLAITASEPIFGNTAKWVAGSWLPNSIDVVGQFCLVIDLKQDSVARQEYEVSFTLRNQLLPQASQTISIFLYTSGKTINAWEEVMKTTIPSDLSTNEGNNAAMLVAGFLHARAWQTSATAGELNRIHIEIATQSSLSVNSTVVIFSQTPHLYYHLATFGDVSEAPGLFSGSPLRSTQTIQWNNRCACIS